MRTSFLHGIKDTPPLIGVFIQIPSGDVVEIVGRAGFDYVILDLEHGCYGLESLRECIRACDCSGLPALCRVPDASGQMISRVLDLGVEGVVVPGVRDAGDAVRCVGEALYPPLGNRGYCSAIRAGGFSTRPGYFSSANENTLLIPLIEDPNGCDNFDSILAAAPIKAAYIGPGDLASFLGVPGQFDHPQVTSRVKMVLKAGVERGVLMGVHVRDVGSARTYLSMGARFFSCGIDAQILAGAAIDRLRVFAELKERTPGQSSI